MRKSSIYLPDELKHALAELAARTGRPEAELIRQAIERLVAVTEGGPARSPAETPVLHARPALVGVGVGPGDPGLVTARARATLVAAERVLVITTDARSIGRAEMVVRSVAPTASIQRVPFAIGADAAARRGSLDDVKEAALAGLDAGELVAVAVLGDATQWTIFPDLAELVARGPTRGHRRHRARDHVVPGRGGRRRDRARAPGRRPGGGRPGRRPRPPPRRPGDDGGPVQGHDRRGGAEGAGQPAPSATAPWWPSSPGSRVTASSHWPQSDDGPISYLATVLFPARSPQPTRGPR